MRARSRLRLVLVHRPDGELVVVAGASRSGKTSYVIQRVRAAPRLLLWDTGDDHRRYGCELIATAADLRARIAGPPKLERIAYQPADPRAQFDFFCRLAWIWLRLARGVLVVEELADVTHPGKAPPAWGAICRKGLRYGPSIYAITQRPSESDKTALGNASLVVCHRMQRADDELYMAKELRVPVADLQKLQPFEWIERPAGGLATRRAAVRSCASGAPSRAK